MLFIPLNEEEKQALEQRHRVERDGRVRDRIKAVLLRNEGWSARQIGQALRLHEDTIRTHLEDWIKENKVKPANGGSKSKLTKSQSDYLIKHLEEKVYTDVESICVFVYEQFSVNYTVSGMTKWLHAHGFSYKEPKGIPSKADEEKQCEFIAAYFELLETLKADETLVFMDSAHPTMATKVSRGWIRKGEEKLIPQTASKTRVNITGAIELSSMKVTCCYPEKVNTETTIAFFDELKTAYPNASTLHVVLDQAGYHRSEETQLAAKARGIELHFLPPYSPNLNPIERLWKVMNEECRNNTFFSSAKEFRQTIFDFFEKTVPNIYEKLTSRINDNFQVLKPVS